MGGVIRPLNLMDEEDQKFFAGVIANLGQGIREVRTCTEIEGMTGKKIDPEWSKEKVVKELEEAEILTETERAALYGCWQGKPIVIVDTYD